MGDEASILCKVDVASLCGHVGASSSCQQRSARIQTQRWQRLSKEVPYHNTALSLVMFSEVPSKSKIHQALRSLLVYNHKSFPCFAIPRPPPPAYRHRRVRAFSATVRKLVYYYNNTATRIASTHSPNKNVRVSIKVKLVGNEYHHT